MGLVTIDDENPGRRQTQEYSVGGALSRTRVDREKGGGDVVGLTFLVLKNCLIDVRMGAVLKRPGSLIEALNAGYGVPLGAGQYETPVISGGIPTNVLVVWGFSTNQFVYRENGVYNDIALAPEALFSNTRQYQLKKLADALFIAGGLPAKWKGPGKLIEKIGISPPGAGVGPGSGSAAAITITSISTGTGITLTAGTQYMYTYHDSTTGLESDWSPLSVTSGPVVNHAIVIAIPAATPSNWNQMKIYRTLDGGLAPYLVTTLPAGTTTYTDTTPDSQLTAYADPEHDHDEPPALSFLNAVYSQVVWWVDAANPYMLRFSKPYTGSSIDLEYYPINNYVMSNQPITALFVIAGKMLVFHPRNISYISGFSVDDFVFQPFIYGQGTLFPNSISTNGQEVIMLAEQGFVAFAQSGGVPRRISEEIDIDLQPLLATSYNANIYASTCWNPALRQFVVMITCQATEGSAWEDVDTGSVNLAEWQNSLTLADAFWENDDGSSSIAQMRVHIWGWSPELSGQGQNVWHEYEFPDIEDANVNSSYPVFLIHPEPSHDSADPQQDKTFIGLWDGADGQIRSIFRKDANDDSGVAIRSEMLTGKLIPGINTGGYKLFHAVGFGSEYLDASADGEGSFSYLLDLDDGHIRNYAPSLIPIGSQNTDIKKLRFMQGRSIHLHLTDSSDDQNKILLQNFFLHYRERFRREKR